MERKTSLRAKTRLRSVEASRRLLRQSLFLEKYAACGDNSELWLSTRGTSKKGHRGSTTKCFSRYHIHTGKACNLNPRQTQTLLAKSSCHSQCLDMWLKLVSSGKHVMSHMQSNAVCYVQQFDLDTNSSSNFLYHWFHAGSFILYCVELCRCEVFALLWDHWWIRECVYLYSLSCRIPTGSKPWGFWIGVMRFCLCCIGSITDPCCPGGWGVPELPGMGPAGTAEAWGGAGEGRPLATGVSCFCAMVWFSAHWPGEQRLLVIASSPTWPKSQIPSVPKGF